MELYALVFILRYLDLLTVYISLCVLISVTRCVLSLDALEVCPRVAAPPEQPIAAIVPVHMSDVLRPVDSYSASVRRNARVTGENSHAGTIL